MSFSPIKTRSGASEQNNSGKWLSPKFTAASFSTDSYVPPQNMPDYYGGHSQKKSFARSHSDFHLPSHDRLGKKNKHIYAQNILQKHAVPSGPTVKRQETDIHRKNASSNIRFQRMILTTPTPNQPTDATKKARSNDINKAWLSDSQFQYSSNNYYERRRVRSPDVETSCTHNIACREPKRAFFKQDYADSQHSRLEKRGMRNFDHNGFGELYVSKYDRAYELTCPDVVYMKSVDRSPNFKTKRWNKDSNVKFLKPKNEELLTDVYAGKMWMMGKVGNNLSRSDGIDMSLGLIKTKQDLAQLKEQRKERRKTAAVKRK
jgi:hypothetical protein